MRVTVGEVGIKAHQPQQLLYTAPPLLEGSYRVVVEWLLQDVADRHARVERRIRVLEDHLHLPAHPSQSATAQPRDVLPVEHDRTRGCRQQSRNESRQGRLTAA